MHRLVPTIAILVIASCASGNTPAPKAAAGSARRQLEAVALAPQACPAPSPAPAPVQRAGEPLIKATVPVPKGPDQIYAALGSLWIFSEDDQKLSRVDPVAKRVLAAIDLSQLPPTSQNGLGIASITGGPDGLWFEWGSDPNAQADNQLVRVDTSTNQIAGDYKLSGVDQVIDTPSGLWATTNSIFAAAGVTGAMIHRIDPATGHPVGAGVPIGDGKLSSHGDRAVIYASGSIWISEPDLNWLVQFDPASGAVKRVSRWDRAVSNLDASSAGVFAGTLTGWQTSNSEQGLAVVDAATGCPTSAYDLGHQTGNPNSPVIVAAGGSAVYVAYKDSAAARLDLGTHTLAAVDFRASVSDVDEGLALESGRVWYSMAASTIVELNPAFG